MVVMNSGTAPVTKNSVLKKQYKKRESQHTHTNKKNLKTFSTKY